MLRPVTRKHRRFVRPRVVVPIVAVGVVAAAVPVTMQLSRVSLQVDGPRDGALVGAAALKTASFRVVADGNSTDKVTLQLDGKPVTGKPEGPALVVPLAGLPDGAHRLVAELPGTFPGVHTTVRRSFTVDTTPPALHVDVPKATSLKQAVTLTGTASGATSVLADGKKVAVDAGKFSVHFATPPVAAKIVARDAAGNTSEQTIDVPVRYPDKIRAIHETGLSWTFDRDRNEALQLAREHKINAVQLDIKDEDGIVNFDPHVPLASQIGAVRTYYDPAKVAAQLHGLGVRLIGRIVAFRDPALAGWAWNHGHKEWVIQTPTGQPWGNGGYGTASFTNFSDQQVRDYNIAIAKAAAKAGFDDVIFDYIRRPDGNWNAMRVPNLPHTNAAAYQAINTFAEQSRTALRPLGAFVGAALFAQAVNAPQDTAQNVPQLAKYLDVVTPMDYPSHWLHGEYGVPDPNAGPQATYDIVHRSLVDWAKAVKGTNCAVVPWLQAEDFRGDYTPAMVASQIKGARDSGMPGFILWNANAYYLKWEPALTADAPRVIG